MKNKNAILQRRQNRAKAILKRNMSRQQKEQYCAEPKFPAKKIISFRSLPSGFDNTPQYKKFIAPIKIPESVFYDFVYIRC